MVGTSLTPNIAREMGLKETQGFLITGITPGGPADKYGLLAAQLAQTDTGTRTITEGDIILKIDIKEVKEVDVVLSYFESNTSGRYSSFDN